MEKVYLFLDDIRKPSDAYIYTNNEIYLRKKWSIVRNYNEFINFILENGVPYFISFDHDLADEHYVPQEFWDDFEKSKKYQEKQVYIEKNGYECAKWLVDYCNENNLKIPFYTSHSLNPVGRTNIIKLLMKNF